MRWNCSGGTPLDSIELHPDFRDFLSLLNEHRAEYLVIGGYAVNAHGYSRPTGDLDVWVAISPDNAERVFDVIVAFGFGTPDLSRESLLTPGRIVRMGLQPVCIEVCNTIDGVHFAECQRRAVVVEVAGVAVPFIGLADLRQNKKSSGRMKDLVDLDYLPKP